MNAARTALALLLLLTGLAWAQRAEVELDDRTFDLARQLRCPTCVSESVADSSARISREMRTQIREMLEQGHSEAEVLAYFQERYGDWILLEPPRRGIHLVVWWLPWIAGGTGALTLIVLLVQWTRKGQREEPLADEDRARVRSALDADDTTARGER